MTVQVIDASTEEPISGAKVDVTGPESRSGFTNQTGLVEFPNLLVGDYTANASAEGYQPNSTSFKLDQDKLVHITLIPEFPSTLILPIFMVATLLAVIVYRRKH